MTPLATVVVPLHNHAQWVGPMLESLFAQWRPDLSLLIIDDASTDSSLEAALQVLQAHPTIIATVLRNEYPRHNAVAAQVPDLTSAPILIKADSDDIALPGRLDATLAAFEADPACQLVTSNAIVLTTGGTPVGVYEPDMPSQVIDTPIRWAGTTTSNLWLGATMAFRRELLSSFPHIDPILCPYGFDTMLAFRATLLGTHHYISRPLVGWRQHPRNTHRLAGAASLDAAARENYAALDAMVLAQRLRDARHHAGRLADPASLAETLACCAATASDAFDHWCRIRNSLSAPAITPRSPASRVTAVPPIVTLMPGLYDFGRAGPLGAVAAAWPGFHGPEESWTWTAAAALLVVRLPTAVDRISLTLSGNSWNEGADVAVSANLEAPVQARMPAHGRLVLHVPVPGRWQGELVLLLIEVPRASYSGHQSPIGTDLRRLGAMLLTLDVPGVRADTATPIA